MSFAICVMYYEPQLFEQQLCQKLSNMQISYTVLSISFRDILISEWYKPVKS